MLGAQISKLTLDGEDLVELLLGSGMNSQVIDRNFDALLLLVVL